MSYICADTFFGQPILISKLENFGSRLFHTNFFFLHNSYNLTFELFADIIDFCTYSIHPTFAFRSNFYSVLQLDLHYPGKGS